MDHHHFTVEELMTDDSFISYCLRRNEEAVTRWETTINAQPHNQPIFSEAEQLVQLLHSGLTKKEIDVELEQIQHKIRQRKAGAGHEQEETNIASAISAEKKPAGRKWLYAGIAASLLACAFLFFEKGNKASSALSPSLVTVSGQTGIRKEVHLPDGTVVYLNSKSSVSWNEAYNVTDRQVQLTGSAFFKVAKNAQKPFVVHSGALSTTALGTAFYVRQLPSGSDIQVSLLEGKINVEETGNSHRNIVYPGEEMTYSLSAHSLQKQRFDTAVLRNWLAGRLAFTNMKLKDVVKEISFWYNVPIGLANASLDDKLMTGTYQDAPLDDVLKVMSFSLKFTYTSSGNTITIH